MSQFKTQRLDCTQAFKNNMHCSTWFCDIFMYICTVLYVCHVKVLDGVPNFTQRNTGICSQMHFHATWTKCVCWVTITPVLNLLLPWERQYYQLRVKDRETDREKKKEELGIKGEGDTVRGRKWRQKRIKQRIEKSQGWTLRGRKESKQALTVTHQQKSPKHKKKHLKRWEITTLNQH